VALLYSWERPVGAVVVVGRRGRRGQKRKKKERVKGERRPT
jgi:hypothetical protein